MLRKAFPADWAFATKGAIENTVRQQFPSDLRSWPLLQAFNFEAYSIDDSFMVLILRDKLSGVPAGPGTLKPFPFDDHPRLPALVRDADAWQQYLHTKFGLRDEDAALILPIYDNGSSDAGKDFKLFSDSEKELWHRQLSTIISRQRARVSPPVVETPHQPMNVTYNITGANSRVNINSQDSSVNVVAGDGAQVFSGLRAACGDIQDPSEKQAVETAIDEMEAAWGTDQFLGRYQAFMSAVANHMTVFAPLLPALAGLLG